MAPSGGGILRRLEPGWRVWDQAGGIWGGLGEGVWEVWEGGVGVAGRRASLCARPVRPGSADTLVTVVDTPMDIARYMMLGRCLVLH